MFLLGLVLSIFHAFSSKSKDMLSKTLMLFFAMSMNGLTGIIAGLKTIQEGNGLLTLFPCWNIIMGVSLLYQIGLADDKYMKDTDAKVFQLLVGVFLITLLFLITHAYFRLHWSITFSICISYITSLNNIISYRISNINISSQFS